MRHTGRRGRGMQPLLPAPRCDPVEHERVARQQGDGHVASRVVAGDDRRGLVVPEHDDDEVVVGRGQERREAAQGVGDRVGVGSAHPTGVRPDVGLRGQRLRHPSKTEPSPTVSGLIIRGVRDHGAWLLIRSISAMTGTALGGGPAPGAGTRRGCTGPASSDSRTSAPHSRRCASRRPGRSRRTCPGASRACSPGRSRPCATRRVRTRLTASRAEWSRGGRSAAGCPPTARTGAWSGRAS